MANNYRDDDRPQSRNRNLQSRRRNNQNYQDDEPRRQRPAGRYRDYDDEDFRDNGSNKKLIIGGIAVVAALCLGAGIYFISSSNSDAKIIAVSPAYQQSKQPYNSCDKVATSYATKNQKNGETGTLIGGVAGAAAGAAIGGNATHGAGGAAIGGATGALGGGLLGGAIEKSNQPNYVYHTGYKTQCKTLYKQSQVQIGYNTQFIYRGNVGSVLTQSALVPGSKIPFTTLQSMVIQPPQPQ